jgi:hypothetical protein
VEADLQRFYNMDLADMYRGTVTVRKVCVLVMNLPRGSATWQALGGQVAVTAEVEASWLIEYALFTIAHGQGGGKGRKPEMRKYPPGLLEAAEKSKATLSKAEAFRAKHLNK